MTRPELKLSSRDENDYRAVFIAQSDRSRRNDDSLKLSFMS